MRKLSSDQQTDLALLILRLGMGVFMFVGHGLGKLQSVFAGDFDFGDPIGLGPGPSLVLAAFAEGICSLLVAAGLFTRAAVVPLIITMSVAAFIVHADDPFLRQEKSLMFLVTWITVLLAGPGRYSLDRWIRGSSRIRRR